ncbi:MAG: FAD-dependent oxidoreductase [Pseudomonadota bacterium]
MIDDSQRACVIAGAGHAGAQCAHRLRRLGWRGRVLLLDGDEALPYHRPPLSKAVLQGTRNADQVALFKKAAYEKAGIEFAGGTRVVEIDRLRREVRTDDGATIGYHSLVLASGARVRRLDIPGADLDGVFYLRTLDDAQGIRERVRPGYSAVIVGGGYIGLEAAASLRVLGMEVTLLEAAGRILQRVTCEPVSQFFHRLHAEAGISVQTGAAVQAFTGAGSVEQVLLADGRAISASLVVVGIGVDPDVSLAAAAGLATDDGISVDSHATTSDPSIYAIGDCASIEHAGYGRRVRLESVQNANDQALVAASAIAGKPMPYTAVPWFWSDQYAVKLQIAGLAQGYDRVEVDGQPDSDDAMAVRYYAGDRLLAVDAINRAKDFVAGRKEIGETLSAAASRTG